MPPEEQQKEQDGLEEPEATRRDVMRTTAAASSGILGMLSTGSGSTVKALSGVPYMDVEEIHLIRRKGDEYQVGGMNGWGDTYPSANEAYKRAAWPPSDNPGFQIERSAGIEVDKDGDALTEIFDRYNTSRNKSRTLGPEDQTNPLFDLFDEENTRDYEWDGTEADIWEDVASEETADALADELDSDLGNLVEGMERQSEISDGQREEVLDALEADGPTLRNLRKAVVPPSDWKRVPRFRQESIGYGREIDVRLNNRPVPKNVTMEKRNESPQTIVADHVEIPWERVVYSKESIMNTRDRGMVAQVEKELERHDAERLKDIDRDDLRITMDIEHRVSDIERESGIEIKRSDEEFGPNVGQVYLGDKPDFSDLGSRHGDHLIAEETLYYNPETGLYVQFSDVEVEANNGEWSGPVVNIETGDLDLADEFYDAIVTPGNEMSPDQRVAVRLAEPALDTDKDLEDGYFDFSD